MQFEKWNCLSKLQERESSNDIAFGPTYWVLLKKHLGKTSTDTVSVSLKFMPFLQAGDRLQFLITLNSDISI